MTKHAKFNKNISGLLCVLSTNVLIFGHVLSKLNKLVVC